jgi:hypothetical protein
LVRFGEVFDDLGGVLSSLEEWVMMESEERGGARPDDDRRFPFHCPPEVDVVVVVVAVGALGSAGGICWFTRVTQSSTAPFFPVVVVVVSGISTGAGVESGRRVRG